VSGTPLINGGQSRRSSNKKSIALRTADRTAWLFTTDCVCVDSGMATGHAAMHRLTAIVRPMIDRKSMGPSYEYDDETTSRSVEERLMVSRVSPTVRVPCTEDSVSRGEHYYRNGRDQ